MGIDNSERCFHLEMSVMQSSSSSSQLPVVVSPYRKSSFFCLLIMIRTKSLLLLSGKQSREGMSNQMLRILPDTSLPGLTQACFNAYHYWDHFSFPALTDDNNLKQKKNQAEKLLKTSAGFNYTAHKAQRKYSATWILVSAHLQKDNDWPLGALLPSLK